MKRYKVTGLQVTGNKRNGGCQYRNVFDTLEEAEHWYQAIMQRKAINFVLLYDNETGKHLKMDRC